MDVFIGSVMTFSFGFAPRYWSLCSGQIMNMQQNIALYSLIGTAYGGNGTTTFGLPDLRGRIPMNQGTGAGLSQKNMGNAQGVEQLALTLDNLPPHTHIATLGNLQATTSVTLANPTTNPLTTPTATNAWIGASTVGDDGAANIFSTGPGASPVNQKGVNTTVAGDITIAMNGAGAPFSILNPFLVVNFSIALQGLFPPRN